MTALSIEGSEDKLEVSLRQRSIENYLREWANNHPPPTQLLLLFRLSFKCQIVDFIHLQGRVWNIHLKRRPTVAGETHWLSDDCPLVRKTKGFCPFQLFTCSIRSHLPVQSLSILFLFIRSFFALIEMKEDEVEEHKLKQDSFTDFGNRISSIVHMEERLKVYFTATICFVYLPQWAELVAETLFLAPRLSPLPLTFNL